MKYFSILGKLNFVAVGLVLAGCAVGPDYQYPNPVLPASWQEGQQGGLDTRPATLTQWWTEFNDKLLDSLVERATQSNLDLAVAEARIREARAVLGVTGADLWPTLDISGSYARTRSSANSFATGGAGGTSSFF
jgi:multidrug efflux system outer membrane protein